MIGDLGVFVFIYTSVITQDLDYNTSSNAWFHFLWFQLSIVSYNQKQKIPEINNLYILNCVPF